MLNFNNFVLFFLQLHYKNKTQSLNNLNYSSVTILFLVFYLNKYKKVSELYYKRMELPPIIIPNKKKSSLNLDDFFLPPSSPHSQPFFLPLMPKSTKTPKKVAFHSNTMIDCSLNHCEMIFSAGLPQKPNKIYDKFFKIKQKDFDKKKKNLSQSPKKLYGKTINIQMVKEINEKASEVLKKNSIKHQCQQSLDLQNFKSKDFVRDFISKCQEKHISVKKNPLMEQKFSPLINEDTFNKFLRHFYQRKMMKSNSLLEYFKGKNTEVIINNIGKFIFGNVFSPKEQNIASFEYLANLHKDLNIQSQDFDTYKGLFMIGLRENEFPEKDVQSFGLRIEMYRPYIVKPRKFEHISCNKGSFQDFLKSFHEKIKENGMIKHLVDNISDETALTKHKKLFNHMCLGYDNFNFHGYKEDFIEFLFKKENFCWQQCFELKTIIRNELLDMKTLNFHDDFKLFDHQLHNLHKFLLVEPNPYQPDLNESSIDPQLLISLLCHATISEKSLQKIFGSWTINRMQNHCKYIVEFILNSRKNPYKLCDMAPAHSATFITKKEFNAVLNCFHSCLLKMDCKKDEINKFIMNFERTRQVISREQSINEKIDDLSYCVDQFIENLYFYMFGNPDTTQYFVNSDLEYVKYKQKLFFLKLFKNDLDDVDLVDLKAIHLKMGVKPQHFEVFLKYSYDSLIEAHIEKEYVEIFINKIKGLMDYICI